MALLSSTPFRFLLPSRPPKNCPEEREGGKESASPRKGIPGDGAGGFPILCPIPMKEKLGVATAVLTLINSYRKNILKQRVFKEVIELFGLGTQELIIILAIVFLIFGARKLPEIGSGLGKAIKNFKGGIKSIEEGTADKSAEKPKEEARDTSGSKPA
jgi:sec-independent protein translocase protein TatA